MKNHHYGIVFNNLSQTNSFISKWRAALGGKVKIIASGSAAINPLLIQVFQAAKIPLLEGYGLTETSPVVAVNRPQFNQLKIGTVGPLLQNVQVKIAEDGEILIKGPNVMMGYYKQPQKTKEVIDNDGWFSTGDIGTIVNDTFLKITDRKKELFKTSGGKYVAPQFVEGKAKETPYIEHIIVIGENKPVVGAFIQPNWELIKKWCREKNIAYKDNSSIIKEKLVIQLYRDLIAKTNTQLASHEQIRRFELISDTWSVATNELTPTLKLKRRIILEKYNELYQNMFKNQE